MRKLPQFNLNDFRTETILNYSRHTENRKATTTRSLRLGPFALPCNLYP